MIHRSSTAALPLGVACAAGCATRGGQGECQLPDAQRIDAQFPNA